MENLFCQYCGAPNNADARFCKSCGHQFTTVLQTPTNLQPVYPQQPVAPQYPQQPSIIIQPPAYYAPPKKKKKSRIMLVGLLLAIVGCCVMFVGYNQLFLQPIRNTGNEFLSALQNQDYDTAYAMSASNVQSQVGNAAGLQTFMESNGLTFTSYKVSTVNRISGDPVQGLLLADLTLSDGTKYAFEVDLEVGPDNVWLVFGFGAPAK